MGKIYDGMWEKSKQLFCNSKNVKYWPYIGKGYANCNVKILVLGDSHYLSDVSRRTEIENYPWLTNEVIIADYLDQGYSQSFSSFDDYPKWIPQKASYLKGYRNTANLLAHAGNQLSEYVWKNISFFNFFQRPVAPCPGSHEWLEADYESYIKQARDAFDEVMQKLTPDIVLIWGCTKLDREWTAQDKVSRYPNTKFYAINHPSYNIRSYYIKGWHDFLKQNGFEESFAEHHPCHKRVEQLFALCNKNTDSLNKFQRWFGERSLGFTNIPSTGEKRYTLMLIFNEDGSSKLQTIDLALDDLIKEKAFAQNVADSILIENIFNSLHAFTAL